MSITRYGINAQGAFTNLSDGAYVSINDYAAIEQRLAESQREFRAADATIENMQMRVEKLAAECAGLSAELSAIDAIHNDAVFITDDHYEQCPLEVQKIIRSLAMLQIPAYQAFLAEVRAQAHKEGAHFVANRMLAAWDAGFIDDTAKNAADIGRMILTSTEFMADAPEGDFDRSFADGVLEDIAAQLRQGGAA